MLSSKSKSSLSDVANNKITSASKFGRLGSVKLDAESPSPKKNPSVSIDVSPRSADSKPVANRRSPKTSTTPDKQSRHFKGTELQVQLTAVQEDLKKAKEQLAFEEKEKTRVLEELSDSKKAVGEVSEKLAGVLLALKNAEESWELDKFRADELEQSAIEAAQKREKEWNKEFEDIRNQHAVDVAALLSVTEELQIAKHELAITTDAKNTALSHVEDAMKMAEINSEKVEILSGEINRLQSLLDSKLECKSNETADQIRKLGLEVEALKLELEKAKLAEEKLIEMEVLVEGLKFELTDAKKAESDAVVLVDEWKKKAESLESYLEEVKKQSERLVQDSLASLTKQLDESKYMLDDAESEVISHRGKVEALELEVARHKADHEKSYNQIDLAKQEVLDLEKTIEVLKFEIQRVEEEKAQALNNGKLTKSNVERLTNENSKLFIELETTKDDSEKAKKAMEGLASALHEVSIEARDIQERLLIKQAEVDTATSEVEELKLTLKNTQEKYEVMLDEANYEIVCLKKTIGKSETEAKDLRAEWDKKEINLRNTMKNADAEIVSIKLEKDEAVETLERKKNEVKATEEEAKILHDKLKRAESELFAANEAMEEAKAESRSLKTRFLDKVNELQSVTKENDDLRVRDTTASEKIKELSESLTKVSSREEESGHTRGNADFGEQGELYNSDKNFNTLPNVIYVMEDKVDETETENSEGPSEEALEVFKVGINLEEYGSEHAEEGDLVKMKPKICEGETMDKQLPTEMEHYAESIDDELDAKIAGNDLDKVNVVSSQNGNTSPTMHQQLQKKKKAFLLHKFGSLLKKKNTPK